MELCKRFVDSPLFNILLVSGVLGLSALLHYAVPSTSESLFVNWSDVLASSWLRFGANLLLSGFLPGFLFFDILNLRGTESFVRYFIFSYLLSVFVVTFANIVAFFVCGSWMSLSVLILTNCVLFGIWLFVKRGKIGCSGISWKFILAVSCLVLFFLCISSIHDFFIYGDQFDYHGCALSWAETPFSSLNGVIQPFYPWWTFAYLSTLFETTGLPSINTYVLLIVLNMMPVVAFFCLVRTKADTRVSVIASFLAFFTSGFGWIYSSLINVGTQVDLLQQLGWKTHDVTLPNSFLSLTPDLSTGLLLVGLPSLLVVLAIVIDEKETSSQWRYYLLTVALTALTFLAHVEAGVILTGILSLLVLTNCIKNTRLQLSFLSGLFLVLVIDLLAPAQYYTSLSVSLASSSVLLIPVCIVAVLLSMIFSRMYHVRLFNSYSSTVLQSIKNLFSKLRSIDFKVFFSFGINKDTRENSNHPYKWHIKFSLIAFVIALLIVFCYVGTSLMYIVDFFPTYHFDVSSVPLYLYPVRLGAVGVLSLGFLVGCIFLQWHKKEKLPYVLIICIPFIILIGSFGLYQEHRMMKYLPLLLAPFAAVFLTKLADYLPSKIHSKIRARALQVVTVLLILLLSVPSMVLYFQYESLCQDPTHYATLGRRIPLSDSIVSAAEFLLDNSNSDDTLATFPIGYGGTYSYTHDLIGQLQKGSFLPLFAIEQPLDFFTVANDIQLKYVYVSTVEEELINKYYNNGFLNFYTSIATIAHETNETKIYNIPQLFSPSENPECSILDLSAFTSLYSSQNSSFLSFLLFGLSGVQYNSYSYTLTGVNPDVSTIVMPVDPNITSIDTYLDWVTDGGNLVILASDQLGSFSTFLGLNVTGFGKVNSLTTKNTTISIPSIQLPIISSEDSNVTIHAYYAQDQQVVSPFFVERTLGNGTIKYLYLEPLFSYLLSAGNGSIDTLAQITPTIINMLGLTVNNSSTNTNVNYPNYVLESPTYSGNVTGTTDYLTFYAPQLTITQSDLIKQQFNDATVEILGSVTFTIRNTNGSISAGTPQSQEIDPLEIYNDEIFWSFYPGHGTGTVGNVSITQDVSTVTSGNSSTKIAIGDGSYSIRGVYHNFGTTDWSSLRKISVYIYGAGTNGTITLSLFSGVETANDAINWEIVENFNGWKKITLDFSNPTHVGSAFNFTDVKKMYIWFDTPGTRYLDRIALDISGSTQSMPSLTFSDDAPKEIELTLSNESQLIITSENQTNLIFASGIQKFFVNASTIDVFLNSFTTNLTIDGTVTFKGTYGYWLENTLTVHDTIVISGETSFKPTFAEWVTYVYADDMFRNFVMKYPSNPIIYISNLNITGTYTHTDEK